MNTSDINLFDRDIPECFIPLIVPVETGLPEKFNYPFCYDPHPLAIRASEEVQKYITEQLETVHAFGSDHSDTPGIGKMFGVLVVRHPKGLLGYLAAFSGKLGNSNHYPGFVPPVYDMLDDEGFYKKGEAETNIINREIENLEKAPDYLEAISLLKQKKEESDRAIADLKAEIKEAKSLRKIKRLQAEKTLNKTELSILNETLNQESIVWHYKLKELQRYWKNRLEDLTAGLNQFNIAIDALKYERKAKSAGLQQMLFEKYAFINQYGQHKNLIDIFEITDELTPPSGAGECAAPKLLQYAFKHGLQPVTMAEFWWGKSPASEVRKHGHYYPACNGKCKPILGHMLQGIAMEDNPMLINPALNKELPVIYEDDSIVIVNKPSEFLSVPGKKITDSVYSRMRLMYPKADGPLIVHRLDMSTSGIMLIAKNKRIHQHLQSQFIRRKIKKRYYAILDGLVSEHAGEIDLPLRVDLDDRPRQLVCYQYGKPALTRWEVDGISDGQTRIYFYPVTGRTHQLRVHASHPSGLNIPIKGDDLYGVKGDRLYLHAEMIEFTHPVTGEVINIHCAPDF